MADDDTLPIAETFLSIQGEGSLIGTPSAFIRVSGCNLRCGWCDTPYASWSPEGESQRIDDLLRWVAESGLRHAVLTGGEPLLFEPIVDLAARIRAADTHVTIETAGTIDRPAPCDLLSLSPKLANSTPTADRRDPTGAWARRHESRRLNLPAMQALLDRAPARQLKFVVAQPEDLPEIEGLLAQLRGVREDEVMLMPEGTGPPDTGRTAWVVEACLRRGWRYAHRLHIELFGNTRRT